MKGERYLAGDDSSDEELDISLEKQRYLERAHSRAHNVPPSSTIHSNARFVNTSMVCTGICLRWGIVH